MNILTKWSTTRSAQIDARSGLDLIEERIVAELGPRPKLDPVANAEHAGFVKVLADRPRLDELREDLAAAADSFARHPPPFLLDVGLIGAFGVEVIGALLIMKTMGSPPGERGPLSFALAVATIGFTAVTAARTSTRVTAEGSEGGVGAGIKRSIWTLVILLAYSAFVLAITVIRIQNTTDQDASQLELVAQALIMLATCLGPAWIADWLIRRRAPAVLLQKRVKIIRQRLGDAEREYKRAQEAVNRIARDGARWDVEAARLRALYVTQHRLEGAKDYLA